MIDVTLTDDQRTYAEDRARRMAARYAGNPLETIITATDGYLVGELGEVAFVVWARGHGLRPQRSEVGDPFDFTVNGERIEVATRERWCGDGHMLLRRAYKVERNTNRLDLYVGAAVIEPRVVRLYGYALARQLADVEPTTIRKGAPPVCAIPVRECYSMAGLIHHLRTAA